MSPKQKPVGSDRTAIAPYNFVELPDQIVEAEGRPDQDRYHKDRYTGQIDCVLTAASPLYVRCGMTPEQLRQRQEEQNAKDLPAFFYVDPQTQTPVIPGSSLRGMLRAMVEIVSFGKIERVTDQQRYFFRAVAAKSDDPLAQPYKQRLRNVRAGYLVKQGTEWYIRPAKQIGRDGYIKVRERDIPTSLGIHRFNSSDYVPQYVDVSFTMRQTPGGRIVVDRIDKPEVYNDKGIIVTSGNMLETGKTNSNSSPRKNHAVIPGPDAKANLVKIDDRAIEDYRASLTDFQKQNPFDEKMGMLKNGHPVFYCQPERGQSVIFFGQSPNFRVPYRFMNAQRAASPEDFVPDYLKSDAITDLPDAIFGYVRREKQADGSEQALAGRVSVSDARLLSTGNVWLREDESPIVPHILASPKPTTFQHYLVQTGPNDKRQLKHYASQPGEQGETVIRGHKLYWHKGTVAVSDIQDTEFLQKAEAERQNDTQHTQFKPVKPGTEFQFSLHFENLSHAELGALLWVLQIAGDEQYRLKLGMGKPLGMGAVKLAYTVTISDRIQRYTTLFADTQWGTGNNPMTEELYHECIQQFEQYILRVINPTVKQLQAIPRIQSLLTLLRWPGPDPRVTRYMEIERDANKEYVRAARPGKNNDKANEYSERPVLPTPQEVATCSADEILKSPGSASPPKGTPNKQHTSQSPTAPASGSTTNPVSKPQQPKPASLTAFEVGATVKGNRKGVFKDRRGFIPKGAVEVAISKAPQNVIGILPPEHVKGPTGGITARVTKIEQRESITYLWIEPAATEK